MVNERQAVRWGIPSQLLQWVWGVSGFLGPLQPQWQQRFSQRERPGQGIATFLVGHGKAPLEWGVVRPGETVLRREASLRFVALHGVGILQGRFAVEFTVRQLASTVELQRSVVLSPWWFRPGFWSSGLLGLEAAVRHVPAVIGVQSLLIEPAVHQQLWFVDLRFRVSRVHHRNWTQQIRRAGSGSTLRQGAVIEGRGFAQQFRPAELIEVGKSTYDLGSRRRRPVLVGCRIQPGALGNGFGSLILGRPLQRAFPGLPCGRAAQQCRWGPGASRVGSA